MNRIDFFKAFSRIAITRQVTPLSEVELEVYYEELGIYEDAELKKAIEYVSGQPYRTFPTVGDFISAVHREMKPKSYNPWAGDEPRKDPMLAHVVRKRSVERAALPGAQRPQIESKNQQPRPIEERLRARIKELERKVDEQKNEIVKLNAALREKSRLERIEEQRQRIKDQAEGLGVNFVH